MKIYLLTLVLLLATGVQGHSSEKESKDKLSVLFFSRGGGIDAKNRGALDTYISYFENHEHVKLSYTQHYFGREGEVEYCIELKPLSFRRRKILIANIKGVLSDAQLVKIEEVHTCTH